MPAQDSPALLVARFLRSNNYVETLDAFLAEAGLPIDTGSDESPNALTIEQILHEKKLFDLSREFEKVKVDDGNVWTLPAPRIAHTVETLPASSNVLHVAVESVSKPGNHQEDESLIIASGADRSVNMVLPTQPFKLADARFPTSESPILSCAFISSRYCITSSMSGAIALHDMSSGEVLDERRDHFKYAVKVICTTNETGLWVVTAAWDARVLVYWLGPSSRAEQFQPSKLRNPVAQIKLPSNPEAILFVTHPEILTPVLIATRRDSTFLYYYAIPEILESNLPSSPVDLLYLGRQNLAPHSNAWVAFTPSALASSPKDPAVVAVATSAVPHMKLIIVRLLLPPPPKLNDGQDSLPTPPATQLTQAQAELALQDREATAILIHCTTMAPQTPYSTPALAWRPDGSGIYVNGDDGAIRGIESATGKVIDTLTRGHEPATKIRCLWAGWADRKGSLDEIIVSGGFDRRLIVWRPENQAAQE